MIHELRAHYPLNDLLRYFEIPRSTYYERLKASQKVDKYRQIKDLLGKNTGSTNLVFKYGWIFMQNLARNHY